MAHTTPHEEPRKRRDDRTNDRSGERDHEGEERIAAVGGDSEEGYDDEPVDHPPGTMHLHEDDEDVHELFSDAMLDETPVPDDAHLQDFERQGRVRPTAKGPPSHQRLAALPEEMGARFLEGITQTDPTDAEEERELFDDLSTDKELAIRGGEDEEAAPEERPARSPSTPTGSPPE